MMAQDNVLDFGNDIQIPSHITNNLSKTLRQYQIKSLKALTLAKAKSAHKSSNV
ncbi:hypothetical protein [Helicobacter sp. T3_23-1056]